MIIRTVLDLRPELPKFMLQTLLLAASWHKFARSKAPLEVVHIGELPDELRVTFEQLGVVTTPTQPNANDGFSKTSNTIQGVAPVPSEQLLLLDNDVVFTNTIDDLCALPAHCVYGAVAGSHRVSKKQWAHIRKLELAPVPCTPQRPRTALVTALSKRRLRPAPMRFGYANGGVILFAPGYDFQSIWQDQQREIAATFSRHRLANGNVIQSNMAALATAIGTYGHFDWLPPGYNYRHADFALGLCEASDVRLVHMTGFGKRTNAETLSGWINEYWSEKMKKSLHMLRPRLTSGTFSHRLTVLQEIHDKILSIISTYNLDSVAERLIVRDFTNSVDARTQ